VSKNQLQTTSAQMVCTLNLYFLPNMPMSQRFLNYSCARGMDPPDKLSFSLTAMHGLRHHHSLSAGTIRIF